MIATILGDSVGVPGPQGPAGAQGLQGDPADVIYAEGVVRIATSASDTDAQRGAKLLDAYAAATTLTPGGNALSAANRAGVLIPPGRYDLGAGQTSGPNAGHGLMLAVEFVDLIGLDMENTIIASVIATMNCGTVEQTADDVRIRNLTIQNNNSTYSLNNDGTDPWPTSQLPLRR